MWYLVYSILVFVQMIVGVQYAEAAEFGIGVRPAKIEVFSSVDWPYTVPITVTNVSAQQAQVEVSFEKEKHDVMIASPARFSLEGKGKKQVLVTFEEPVQGFAEGFVQMALFQSTENEHELVTGTGMKIPFSIQGVQAEKEQVQLLAGVGILYEGLHAGWFMGAGMILLTLFLLWHIASFVQQIWLKNSNKH
jgi:hypothetical protein